MPVSRRDLIPLCVVAAILVGWIGLKWYPFGIYVLYLGLPGAIPFLLVNGVHGGEGGVREVIAGTLFVLVNAWVYYLIARSIMNRSGNIEQR